MVIIKQCIGIDVSKEYLDCCIGSINIEQEQKLSKTKKFRNTEEGFKELREWVNSERSAIEVIFVMEATGVYYENLAYWLNNQDEKLCILLLIKLSTLPKALI